MRLEVLNSNDEVLLIHHLSDELTLLGKSPGAHVHLSGKNVGSLHVAIKGGNNPVVMDLGGPSRMRVNGAESIEHTIASDADATLLEIGSSRVRLARTESALKDLRQTAWAPLGLDQEKQALVIRVRMWIKGRPVDVVNTQKSFSITQGVNAPIPAVWAKGSHALAQLPPEWIKLGGKIQVGKTATLKLEDWATQVELEPNTVYRITAGIYGLEILVSSGEVLIGRAVSRLLPEELKKPLGVASALVLGLFTFWMLVFGKPKANVEEPYPVYARLQNIPVEKLPEPEQTAPTDLPQAGGGAGSESKQTTAPTLGGTPQQSAPSKLAQSLTGGLKNLVGNVLSQSRATSSAVVAETGVAAAAAAAGAPGPQVGKLAAVGGGSAAVAGATKLGNLAIAGSGKGFSGGAGLGLGSGLGNGVGNGVGNGIGRGGFRLVEEESIVDGGLDKSVIAAVIQNNLSQIKYCYERQLVAEPDLFGKVVMTWQINASGMVEATTVKQTTLNSSAVEQCMISKISGWKFPQPKNGTKVTVSYPFLFKSTK